MKTLHLLRSEPDETTRILMDALTGEDGTAVVSLYDTAVDYDRLLDAIFAHDRIVTWW